MNKALLTVLMLIISNTFMTFAWYGNLKLQQMKVISSSTPLIFIILISWAIAMLEYSFLIPANRIGSEINGGPFSLVQLKVTLCFKGEALAWNHIVAFILLILAVYFVFIK